MGGPLLLIFAQFQAEFFPLSCGSKGFDILKSAAGQGHMRSAHDTAKIYESFVIHLIFDE